MKITAIKMETKVLGRSVLFIIALLLSLTTYAQRLLDEFKPVFSRAPWLSHIDIQPDGRIIVGGRDVTVADDLIVNQFVRINTDGSVDESFLPLPIESDNIMGINALRDGKILLALQEQGAILVNSDGSIDEGFDLGDISLRGVAQLNDNILIYGYESTTNKIRLIDTNGDVVESFSEGHANNAIKHVSVLGDNSILLGGIFTEFNGVEVGEVIKINSDGTLDETFNVGTGSESELYSVKSGNNSVVFLGGYFSSFSGTSTPGGFVKLNSDGSIDESFILGPVGNLLQYTTQILELDNGKILVAGASTSSGKNRILRLNADGSIDNSFSPIEIKGEDGTRSMEIKVGHDGNMYIVGNFSDLEKEHPVLGLLVLDQDGNQINGFPKFGQIGFVEDAFLQSDGKYLVRGNFLSVNGELGNGVARLNKDGTLDETFAIDEGLVINFLRSIAVQDDGKIILGGYFDTPNGLRSIVRINSDGSYDDTLLIPNLGTSQNVRLDASQNVYFQIGNSNNIYKYDNNGIQDETFSTSGAFPSNYSVTRIFLDDDGTLFVSGYNINGSGGSTGGQVYKIDKKGSLIETFVSTELPQQMLAIKRIGTNEIVMGGSFATAFGASDPNPLYFIDNDGNITDQSSIAIVGDGVKGLDQRYHDIIQMGNDQLLVLGQFKEINGYDSEGVAIISTKGSADFNVDFDLKGFAHTGFLDEDREVLTLFGSYSEVNKESRVSGARIQLTNMIPEITDQISISTEEESPIQILKENLTVTDLDDEYPEGFALEVQEGDNYELDNNTVTPVVDFNGTLSVPVTITDGKDQSEVFIVQIEVTPINDLPEITGTTNSIVSVEDTPLILALGDLAVHDPDNTFPDDFTLTVYDGDNYTVSGNEIIPDQDFDESLSVSVSVSDGIGSSEIFEISVDITPVNDPPSIIGTIEDLVTIESRPINITINDLVIEDSDNELTDLTLTLSEGDNYTLDGNTVIPNSEFLGALLVDATVNDGEFDSDVFTISVEVVEPLSIDEIQGLSLYPNPTKDYLFVKLGEYETGELNMQLLDLFGRIVYDGGFLTKSPNNYLLDLRSVPSGIYLLKARINNMKTSFARIVIK